MTVIDLVTRPELVTQARGYFDNVQLKQRKYTPLIRPQDQPAVWLNRNIMDRYRAEMRKYYYDPATYKTYVDQMKAQLGITYPTVRPATTAR